MIERRVWWRNVYVRGGVARLGAACRSREDAIDQSWFARVSYRIKVTLK